MYRKVYYLLKYLTYTSYNINIFKFLLNIFSCTNSQLSQDMYTFKTFKSLCKSENVDNEILCEEVVKLVNNLMTDKVRQQAFDYITTSKSITQDTLVTFLKSFQANLKEKSKILSDNLNTQKYIVILI